jgi:nitrate/nitrite transporter NarK
MRHARNWSVIAVYGFDIRMAAAIAIAFPLPAGLLRVLGGIPSDRYGTRTVMNWSPEIANFRFLPELQPTAEAGGKQP